MLHEIKVHWSNNIPNHKGRMAFEAFRACVPPTNVAQKHVGMSSMHMAYA
jgi:hypothetical protein